MHVERSSEETQLGYTLNNRATNVIYETSVEFFSEKKINDYFIWQSLKIGKKYSENYESGMRILRKRKRLSHTNDKKKKNEGNKK